MKYHKCEEEVIKLHNEMNFKRKIHKMKEQKEGVFYTRDFHLIMEFHHFLLTLIIEFHFNVCFSYGLKTYSIVFLAESVNKLAVF